MAKNQNTDLFYTLLKLLNVKHTKSFSTKLYEEHPHKDNLFGLSKMLLDYNIPNRGLRFEDKDELSAIETPFVAQFDERLAIVLGMTEDRVDYYVDGSKKSDDLDVFKEKWSGVALVIEPDDQAEEREYKQNKQKETYSNILKVSLFASALIIIAFIGVRQYLFSDLGRIILLALNLIGIYVGYLLILKQIQFHSASADKICSLFKRSNCNNVLESKAAKLWGIIGWSEAGIGYFTSNTIIILFFPILIPFMALINICAMPYSIWSIWYQKVKAKQWCPLCLLVQVLFYAIFTVTLIFGFIRIPAINLNDILSIALVYLIPFAIISLLVPVLSQSLKVSKITQTMNHWKMKDEVFDSLLKSSTYYEVDPSLSQIVFGNPEAATQITVVSNPHCGPCGSAHEKLDYLLDQIGDEICMRLVFINFKQDGIENSGKFLIAAYLNNDTETAREIFYRWYTKEKYATEKTYEKYGYDIEAEEVVAEQEKHKNWSDENEIPKTPTILINGYTLPRIYDITDLRLM